MKHLNWVGLIALIVGFSCFGLIGFKRSVWKGPTKSVLDDLDSTEKQLAKVGLLFLVGSSVFFVIAHLL